MMTIPEKLLPPQPETPKPQPETGKPPPAEKSGAKKGELPEKKPTQEKSSTKETPKKPRKEEQKSPHQHPNILNDLFGLHLTPSEKLPPSKTLIEAYEQKLQKDGIDLHSPEGLQSLVSLLVRLDTVAEEDESFKKGTQDRRNVLRFFAYNLYKNLQQANRLSPDKLEEVAAYFSTEVGIGGGQDIVGGQGGIDTYTPGKTIEELEQIAQRVFELTQRTGRIPEVARDWILHEAHFRDAFIDQLLSLADQLPTTPTRETQDFYTPIIRNQFLNILQGMHDRPLIVHYGELIEVREKFHDMAVVAEVGTAENLLNFANQVPAQNYDLVFLTSGVGTGVRSYERAYKLLAARNHGRLPIEKIVYNHHTQSSELDNLARSLLEELNRRRKMTRIDDKNVRNDNVTLNEREVNRALNMARGFHLGTLRAGQHVAHSAPRDPEKFFQYLNSLYAEGISREINPVRWIIQRFGIGSDVGHVTAGVLAYPEKLRGPWQNIKNFFFNKNGMLREIHRQTPETLTRRVIDLENLSGTGDFLTGSTWRVMNLLDFTEEQGGEQMQRQAKEQFGFTIETMIADEDAEANIKKGERGTGEDFEQARRWQNRRFREDVREKIQREKSSLRIPAIKRLAERDPLQAIMLLAEIDPLLREHIFQRALPGEWQDKTIVEQVEVDLATLAEERTKDRWQENSLDFTLLENMSRRARAESVATATRELIDPAVSPDDATREAAQQNLTALGMRRYPYAPSWEDIPWEEVIFAKTGGRALARKIADWTEHIKGWQGIVEFIVKFPEMQDLRQAAHYLKEKVWEPFSHYNAHVAHIMMEHVVTGTSYLVKKDARAEIPLFGLLYSLRGRNSVMQEAYGGRSFSANAVGLNDFIEESFSIGGLTREQAKKIKQRVGASWIHRSLWIVEMGLLGIAAAGLFEFFRELFKREER